MTTRVHNFCAGPCTLPTSVLEEVRDELIDFHGLGMSIIEDSHRAPAYEAIDADVEPQFTMHTFAAPETYNEPHQSPQPHITVPEHSKDAKKQKTNHNPPKKPFSVIKTI